MSQNLWLLLYSVGHVRFLRYRGKMYSCASAFSKTCFAPELRWILSCKSLAVFLHFPQDEKEPWGSFYQLQQVLAKGRNLLQILLKSLATIFFFLPWIGSIEHKSVMFCTSGKIVFFLIAFLAGSSSCQSRFSKE